jgi:hypothetical protein
MSPGEDARDFLPGKRALKLRTRLIYDRTGNYHLAGKVEKRVEFGSFNPDKIAVFRDYRIDRRV